MKVRNQTADLMALWTRRGIINGRTNSKKPLVLGLKLQRCLSSHASNNNPAGLVAAKNNNDATTLTTKVSTQIKTVANLFADMVKTNAPNIKFSLSDLSKMRILPMSMNSGTKTTETALESGKVSGLPTYLNVMGSNQANNKDAGKGEEVTIPLWKIKRKTISQESIDARTKHVVSAVAKAVSKPSLLARLEDLSQHLFQYPQAKSLAAREGAVSVLLRLKHNMAKEELIQRQIRESLALLGYAEPLPGKGIRILSIDGGGTRGLLALHILRHIEEKVGRPIYESFDYICGVSTGAILALLIGASKKSVAEVETMYREISTEVFRQDRSSGLATLLWNHAYYNSEKWEKILQDKVGETTMIRSAREPRSVKVSAISSVVNHQMLRPFVFRNYTLPFRVQSQYPGTFRHKMWEAARASSAAPGYFSEFKLEENIHQDGGLFVNNPCAVAIHEARCIWPGASLQSVVSVGTGRCQPLDTLSATAAGAADPTTTSWKQKLSKVIDSATDTERVHTVLHDLLPPKVYYRFNPYLSEISGLDETDPVRWGRMLDDADMYIRKNQRKMDEAASSLTVQRSTIQTVQNWVTERRMLMKNTTFY